MGIQTLIRNIRQKREEKKAREKGQQLTDSGQQQVATTSGYVNVPAKATDTGQSYNVVKPATPVINRNGGGGTHNGVSSNPTTITPALQMLQTSPSSTTVPQGSGGLRDYQFKKTVTSQTISMQSQLQREVNAGRISTEQANKNLRDFQIRKYRQEGYTVTENADGSFSTTYNLTNVPKTNKLGGVFLKKKDLESYSANTSKPFTPINENDLMMQDSISQTEQMFGLTKGSTGAGYVPSTLVSTTAPPLRETGGVAGNIIQRYEKFKGGTTGNFILGTGALGVNTENVKVYAGTIPITPASYLGGVQNLKFLGTTKVIGTGEISTDVLFVVKNRVGFASGVTKTGEGLSQTVVAGKTGIIGVKFPTGATTTGRVNSFVSQGLSKEMQVGEFTRSVGVSASASAKGDKIINTVVKFPTGRLSSKVNPNLMKDLSLSESLSAQSNDLIKVVGRSKSVKGNPITYSGVLKIINNVDESKGYTSFGRGTPKVTQKQIQSSASSVIEGIAGSLPKSSNTLNKVTSISSSSLGFNKGTTLVSAKTITPLSSTERISVVSPSLVSSSQNINQGKINLQSNNLISLSDNQFSKIDLSALTKVNTRNRTKQTSNTIQSISQSISQNNFQPLVQREAQRNIQSTKQIQSLVQKQSLKTGLISFSFARIPFKTPPQFPKFKKEPSIKSSNGFFSVSIRRFGKFKTIGRASTYQQAFNIGRQRVTNTLGATFKVSGKGNGRTPFGFYTKQSKEGTLFIEKNKFRLSTGGEKKEINMFRQLQGGIKI